MSGPVDPEYHQKYLDQEVEIHWSDDFDLEELDFVREFITESASFRQRKWKMDVPGEVVGYSILSEDAENVGNNGMFARRIFFLKDQDGDGNLPLEAVDPLSVEPGKPGEQVTR